MKSILVLIEYGLLYSLLIWLIIRKYCDVRNNPDRYDNLKRPNSFYYSRWHDKENSHSGRHYWAGNLTFVPMFIIMAAANFLLTPIIQKAVFFPYDSVWFIKQVGIDIALFPALFLSMLLPVFVCYLIEKPIFTAATMQAFSSKRRSDDWRKMLTIMLIIVLIGFPVHFLGFNNYAYWTGSEIVNNSFFQITERVYTYDEIQFAEAKMHLTRDNQDYYFEYIIHFSDGVSINVYPESSLHYRDDVLSLLRLNQDMMVSGVIIQPEVLSAEKVGVITSKTDKEVITNMFGSPDKNTVQ